MHEDKLDKTLELTTSILSTRDLDTLLRTIADGITDDFGFEQCDLFLLNDEKDAFVLRMTKGYPSDLSEKLKGLAKSVNIVNEDFAATDRLGRFTYLYKATPETNPQSYYGILHPERATQPREHPDDWQELDVLYVALEDAEGNMIGFMEPDGPRSGKLPSKALVANLEIFAGLASIAVANAELLGRLEKTVKHYRAMLDSTASLQESTDLNTTLKTIGDNLNEFVPYDELSIYRVDWAKGLLVPLYATGPYADEVMADTGGLTGVAGLVAKSGEAQIVEDSVVDERVEDIPGIEDLEIAQTMIVIPLRGKAGVEGVLELYRDKSKKFTEMEFTLAERFAAHAAIAIENAKLREELKDNFESVQSAYDEVKDLDRMKDSLVDTISHEMRTPLTTILGYLEMASAGMYGEVPPKMRPKFDTMIESVKRINHLVSAMLELSRLEKKTLKLDFEPVNIAMVTREVLKELEPLIAARKHKVAVLFGSELPTAEADRLRMHDVVENLLSNAIKYTNPGGEITIGADILGGKMHMWVKDNGIGIPPEEQDRIFDRFFLAEAGLTREDGRLGVGLHISREIVKRHGGDMWFESIKGVGSTFHFAIPLTKPS